MLYTIQNLLLWRQINQPIIQNIDSSRKDSLENSFMLLNFEKKYR